MLMKTAASEAASTDKAVTDIVAGLVSKGLERPDFLLVAYTVHHQPEDLRRALAEQFPETVVLGGSSCRGVATDEGLFGFGEAALGTLAIHDKDGDFGAAVVEFSDGMTVQESVAFAVKRAQETAGRPGEVPDLVWVQSSPGKEELVIAGLRRVLGRSVLIAGGSAADEAVAGDWSLFDRAVVRQTAVGIALLYTDSDVTHRFQSGYLPTKYSGTVTRASGRILAEIDGQPAAKVYDAWTDGTISAALSDPSKIILADTSWHPLGKPTVRLSPGDDLSVDYFCLVHPERVGQNGELHLYADIDVGTQITLMKSGPSELIERTADVVRSSVPENPPAGALMVFCAGCMLALGDDIQLAAAESRSAFGEAPFMTIFTFGEQGSQVNGVQQHGNLMVSATVFKATGSDAHI